MSGLPATFAALGDATRFAIVERLLNEGELSAGTLLEGVTISPPAVSRHLKVLREAGVIVQRVDGQRRLYSVRPEAVEAIGAWTISHREFWEASLKRLEAALMEEMKRK
ncbi:MAG: metalloregulator ArsR/SmtB family transcription factor [Salaquimonas sp.]|jgi:DNA-binding transcriptional ArsR family regulator|nr:metalloregulator ArsR/SmtB family transcription factor [Salaquimonas sp.]